MKIMHVIGSKKAGGAETFFLRLITSLSNYVEIIAIVKQNSWIEQSLNKNKSKHPNIKIYTAPFGGFFDFKTKKIIKNIIKKEQPDFIQGWMNRGVKFLPKKSKNPIPTAGRMGGAYNLKYYKNCHYIFCNTKKLCDYVKKEGFNKEKVFYLPNFVPEPETNFKENKEKALKSLNLKPTDFICLIAGRLHQNKGIDTAIKAMAELEENFHLIIAGEGPLKKELEALAKQKNVKNKVHFVGWVSNISFYASCAKAWLAPSTIEPLGNIVLDAWVHKIPIIASKSDGPLSLISHNKNGILTEIGNHKQLASAIKKLHENNNFRKELAKNGYEYGKNNFSESIAIKQYLDIYNKKSVKNKSK